MREISIHAPREGSDLTLEEIMLRTERISIHAPREGSDDNQLLAFCNRPPFLSTLPARGATRTRWRMQYCFPISIHAPREGSDEDFFHYFQAFI